MALSDKYRWIMVGSLLIRGDRRVAHRTTLPTFTLEEVINAAKTRTHEGDEYRDYENKSRTMACSQFGENDGYHYFLVHTGDKNVPDISLMNFDTHISRDIEKEENEGNHYTSHILVRKDPDEFGRHLILIEKVPGIHITSLQSHFGWICRDERFEKTYVDEHEKQKKSHPIFEIQGYQSNTVREVLATGSLQDIEFVSHEKKPEGLDEEPLIREVSYRAIWDVRQHVSESQARRLLDKILTFRAKLPSDDEKIDMYVRIKTNEGHVKRTEVEGDADSILEQAFIQHEKIDRFAIPLTSRYEKPRQDILTKMMSIAANL